MKVKALREKKLFANIREMVEEIGSMYEGRVAYRYRLNPRDKEPVKVNYEDLRADVRGLGSELVARDLSGKKIVVIGRHSYPWIQSYYSILAVGSVLVPLDKDWAVEDLIETVKTAEADFLFCDKEIEAKGLAIAEALSLPAPHIFFIHLPINGYLSCFHILTIVLY